MVAPFLQGEMSPFLEQLFLGKLSHKFRAELPQENVFGLHLVARRLDNIALAFESRENGLDRRFRHVEDRGYLAEGHLNLAEVCK